ncbi:hypothetical protein [Rhizobium sp. KDH_Rht_773_N]
MAFWQAYAEAQTFEPRALSGQPLQLDVIGQANGACGLYIVISALFFVSAALNF